MSTVFNEETIQEAANQIKAGNLVAFPTETVYGLGADATNETAVKKVYQAKGRPSDNPLIVHVADVSQVEKYAVINDRARKLMDKFWPGPLTIILPIKPNALSKTVTGGLNTAAFRNPANKKTIELIKLAGVPIVGPSANTSGKPSPTKVEHVLHDLDGKIAGVLDDGETKIGVESTVIDISGEIPSILRPGAITREDLLTVLPNVQTPHHKVGKNEIPKAPGMKYKHYAPSAQVYIVKDEKWNEVFNLMKNKPNEVFGLMATDKIYSENGFDKLSNVKFKTLGNDVSSASYHLFDGLRTFDLDDSIKEIYAQGFDETKLGVAYMNRLKKSSGNTFFE